MRLDPSRVVDQPSRGLFKKHPFSGFVLGILVCNVILKLWAPQVYSDRIYAGMIAILVLFIGCALVRKETGSN